MVFSMFLFSRKDKKWWINNFIYITSRATWLHSNYIHIQAYTEMAQLFAAYVMVSQGILHKWWSGERQKNSKCLRRICFGFRATKFGFEARIIARLNRPNHTRKPREAKTRRSQTSWKIFEGIQQSRINGKAKVDTRFCRYYIRNLFKVTEWMLSWT